MKTGDYGNSQRDLGILLAKGDLLVFCDDDDTLAEGALQAVRDAANEHPGRLLIFQMRYGDGGIIWRQPIVEAGNIGTPCLVVPNIPGKVARWSQPDPEAGVDGGHSDLSFLQRTLQLRDNEPPVFVPHVICNLNPRPQ